MKQAQEQVAAQKVKSVTEWNWQAEEVQFAG